MPIGPYAQLYDTNFYHLGKFVGLIQAYAPALASPESRVQFDEKTKKFTLLTDSPDDMLTGILDAMTLAVEAGTVSEEGWLEELFADKAEFGSFILELSDYEYRINDRWYQALMRLAGRSDEKEFVTHHEIAQALLLQAKTTNQL